MKVRMVVLLVMFVGVVVISPGCLNSSPAVQPVQNTPSSPASVANQATPVTSVPVPVAVTTVPTGAIQNPAAPEYIRRPYGFVPSTYHPGYQARLQESHLDKDLVTGDRRIVGTVKNTGSERIDLLVVTADLYNNQGYLVGTSSVDVYYLEPGKTWEFRTDPITVPDYSYYEIASVFTG
ncbi:MAG TPA: FxLYD domain-containing protein [Methanoregulaceae archaeon]|nr:FxLYD domain-containing protein [Methanoregulaceae archaeon]